MRWAAVRSKDRTAVLGIDILQILQQMRGGGAPGLELLDGGTKPPASLEVPPARPLFLTAKDIGIASKPIPIESIDTQGIVSSAGGSSMSRELRRICALEVCEPMPDEEVEAFSHANCLATALASGFRLKRSQAEGLSNYLTHGGLLGSIGVGDGKTLLSLMILAAAYRMRRRSPLLAIPAHMFRQLSESDVRTARTWVPFDMPIHYFPGRTSAQRLALARSGARGVFVITHSLLSQPEAHEVLDALRPETVVIDEAHAFANPKAARTRRMLASLKNVELCAISGTMTKKKLRDYHHLAQAALKDKSFMPHQASLTDEWGILLDSDANIADTADAGVLTPLIRWAYDKFPDHRIILRMSNVSAFRKAFKLRKDTCPGTVTTGDARLGSSLLIQNVPAEEKHPDMGALKGLISDVEDRWLAPDGDEISEAREKYKWLSELSAGFYNKLVWPTVPKMVERRGISEAQAQEILDDARVAHEARQEYNRQLRKWLSENASNGMDTPLLVEADMARHQYKNVSASLYGAWSQWRALHRDEHPEREAVPVRVCDFKVRAAVDWAKSLDGRGGIIWCYHQEVCTWVYSAIVAAGLPGIHCPAGPRSDLLLSRDENKPSLKTKILCASIRAHGEGKNLQFMDRAYVMQWPRTAKTAEQMLGRLHRTGQESDEVVYTTNNTLEWDHANLASCLVTALYIHQTTTAQKMIYGGWSPLPAVYPPEALIQRGFDNDPLSPEMLEALKRRFGAGG